MEGLKGRFFLGTYAMVEYLAGNQQYAGYMDGGEWITSMLNLTELYYAALRDHGDGYAERVCLAFRPNMGAVEDEDVQEGMRTRLRMKAGGLDLSYADAVGYSMAVRTRRLFLTGDKAFSGLPGVEYVR